MAVLIRVLVIFTLVGLNAFFAASEYSLLRVRRTRIEQLVREGNSRARLVQTLLSDIGLLISGTQLGMTVVSLLMGWLGEKVMASFIEGFLEGRLETFVTLVIAHAISSGAAFILITCLLMVMGELVPRTIAYDRAEYTALHVARPMLAFLQFGRPLVRALEGMAGATLRVLGRKPGQSLGGQHTAEEVKLIVAGIRKRGMLGVEQEEMIQGVFDLHKVLVREIMMPRPQITCLPLSTGLRALLERIVEDEHSRIPIYEGDPDRIVGVLFTKDLHRVILDRLRQGESLDAPFELRSILHAPMIVPETMALNQMLDMARRRRSQMALVVDEFGTFVGLVTIEDVLEQIVGDIGDEYDREEKVIHQIGENVLVVDGSLSLLDLADDYEVVLPRDQGYATLAGFVLAHLGFVPTGGESFVFEGCRYTVLEMNRRRVARVKVEKLLPATRKPTLPPADANSPPSQPAAKQSPR